VKIKKKSPLARSAKRTSAPAPAARPQAGAASPEVPAQDVADVLPPDAIAFSFWREWQRARERGEYGLIRAMVAPGSPFDTLCGPSEDFARTVRQRLRPIPGFDGGELMRVRLRSSSEAEIFVRIEGDRRGLPEVTVERFYLLRGETGWRCHSVDRTRIPSSAGLEAVAEDAWPTMEYPEGFAALVETREAEERTARAEARAAREERLRAAAETPPEEPEVEPSDEG
jgi:hypothetical protein